MKSFETKEQATERGALKKAIGSDGGSVEIQRANGRFQEEADLSQEPRPQELARLGAAPWDGLTHDVEPKVEEYLGKNDTALRRLMVAIPRGGPSQRADLGGVHADRLAEALVRHMKAERESFGAGDELIYVFIAGPNAFTCYLGRHLNSLEPLLLTNSIWSRNEAVPTKRPCRCHEPLCSSTARIVPAESGDKLKIRLRFRGSQ